MNFLKFIVPLFLQIVPDSFIHAYGWELPLQSYHFIYLILTGDILQLAGVALLFMGLIHKLSNKHKNVVLYLSLLVLLVTEFVRGFKINIVGVDYIFDLLWGKDYNVYFSLFPWFVYILVGMYFGYYFKENNRDEKKIFNRMLWFGLLNFIIGGLLCWFDYDFHMRDYFHTGIGGVLFLLGCNLLFFSFCYWVLSNTKKNRIMRLFFYSSKNITSLYIIQWILICWAMGVFGYHNKGIMDIIPLMVLFTIGTFLMQKIFDYLRRNGSLITLSKSKLKRV